LWWEYRFRGQYMNENEMFDWIELNTLQKRTSIVKINHQWLFIQCMIVDLMIVFSIIQNENCVAIVDNHGNWKDCELEQEFKHVDEMKWRIWNIKSIIKSTLTLIHQYNVYLRGFPYLVAVSSFHNIIQFQREFNPFKSTFSIPGRKSK
jgi:hypothetical protein